MLHVWNIYQHLPHKSPSVVGKYTIHGALGYGLFSTCNCSSWGFESPTFELGPTKSLSVQLVEHTIFSHMLQNQHWTNVEPTKIKNI